MYNLIAMAGPAGGDGAAGGGNPFLAYLPFILMIAIFYFLIIRPQQKKQKEHQAMLSAIGRGDRVVTTGGIIGTVIGTDEEKVVIKTGNDDIKLEIARNFISGKLDKV